MKERPILFSGQMVRAILEGRKTMTRRVVKPQPYENVLYKLMARIGLVNLSFMSKQVIRCPYGEVGDRLWVRETFCYIKSGDGGKPNQINSRPVYRADRWASGESAFDGQWHPSIHMPRWASRIDLEITSVRVERLNDITEEDSISEGVSVCGVCYGHRVLSSTSTAKERFNALWESINGADSWASNPWVWVVEFRRLDK